MNKRYQQRGKTMEEAKQTNFRVTPEAADKFREYCKENGFNQAQGFAHVMQIIELNNAKEKFRKDDKT